MIAVRFSLSLLRKGVSVSTICEEFPKSFIIRHNAMSFSFNSVRKLSTMQITKNLELISKENKNTQVENLKLSINEDKPLVILLSWMLAKGKHIYKFADYYVNHGFDVLRISITPWQLLWPSKGTQVVASDILKFLHVNKSYAPLFIHGFSVGGYQWGEVLVQIASDQKCYQHVADRIVGQVWDSAADITEVWFGFPMAVFPKNLVLQNAMKQYMLYHMKTFDKVATCHYVRSSQLFHSDLVKAPALLLISKTDPVGAEKSNLRLKEDWENLGIKVYWKCWDKSPHVSHFHYHRKEYIEQLETFLSNVGLIKGEEKIKAKL
ncbi:hypothetical protein ILUMI_01638 [Ignelater luminosus]|uniref:Transmembrane protein 53 n=1 Tax=Ignelater luminosus TaxID=2038154 RepID=A0A8K0DJS3_IGNLU|nr:hypothetical protein ILUMI_01638 [Ignelater luminosus]